MKYLTAEHDGAERETKRYAQKFRAAASHEGDNAADEKDEREQNDADVAVIPVRSAPIVSERRRGDASQRGEGEKTIVRTATGMAALSLRRLALALKPAHR